MGGGLAGLSAACQLLDSGYQVVLIEKRPFLGGRAYSFIDRETGWEVDNGQHVFMGCCTFYIDFLKKIGAYPKAYLQDTLKVRILRHKKEGILTSTSFLGSLHLLPSFLKYPHLSLINKFLALYALLRMRFTNRRSHKDILDAESFYRWLKRHHQTEGAIKNLWNLIVLPTLNDDVSSVSAYMALMIFQEGFLRTPAEAALGFSRVGLSSLSGESAERYIKSHGGTLLLGRTVTALRMQDGRITGV
ncbi:MAG: FAD-dependent oxidoreductase, partial [Chloroflexi bacterium]|nr:FAD-dependent oxidoreductase [Chloroflexota bacterium]